MWGQTHPGDQSFTYVSARHASKTWKYYLLGSQFFLQQKEAVDIGQIRITDHAPIVATFGPLHFTQTTLTWTFNCSLIMDKSIKMSLSE